MNFNLKKNWMENYSLVKQKLFKNQKILDNLKKNWYFPLSALAFFGLNAKPWNLGFDYFFGVFIAFIASLFISLRIPSLFNLAKEKSTLLQIISILTTLGVCSIRESLFWRQWQASLEIHWILSIDILELIIIGIAIISTFFVYFWILMFWSKMAKIILNNKLFFGLTIWERWIYGTILVLSIGFMIFAFTSSEAFYGTTWTSDIIYTSDSPMLVKNKAFIILNNAENDIRQPLFAVFSAPFVGISYLLGQLFTIKASIQAILVNIVQILLLFFTNFILAKMMKLTPLKRMCFMLLSCSTYTYLLSLLMMEQFIISYFWLIFSLYLFSKNNYLERIAFWGASGTLLTNIVLLPLMSNKNPRKNFKEWMKDMIYSGLNFLAIILVFCRFDAIFNSVTRISALSRFTGRNLTFENKFYQYISFISNCFFAPTSEDISLVTIDTHISWQLSPITTLNFIGILILTLTIISFILNRANKVSRIAMGWIIFSIFLFLIIGWGTQENGLILYSLYCCWAFFILLFQLVEKIESKLKTKVIIPIFSVVSAIFLWTFNIPAIMELIDFSITYFPI